MVFIFIKPKYKIDKQAPKGPCITTYIPEPSMNTHDQLQKISDTHGDSFYVLHEQQYIKNITDLKAACNKHYPKVIIGYSYKTNYIPRLCSIAKTHGVFAEVVSEMELQIALKLGYTYDSIIFNGPYKKESDLERTLLGGSIVNLDSYYELESLKRLVAKHPGASFKVGLRINMSLINEDGTSAIQEGLNIGRFGFDTASEEFSNLISTLNALGVSIHALHGHTSTSDRSLKNFTTIVKTLCHVRNTFHLDELAYLNVGGGFFGPMPKGLLNRDTPSFDDYAETIFNHLKKDPWFAAHKPHVILEPGVSVVSNALSFVAKIIDIKKIRGNNFLLIEGGVYNVKPTMHKINLPFKIIAKNKSQNKGTAYYDVVGSTCMEKDLVLSQVEMHHPKPNDFIQIDNVGGYTVVKTPNFINFVPAIVALNAEGSHQIIRNRQTIADVLAPYVLDAHDL